MTTEQLTTSGAASPAAASLISRITPKMIMFVLLAGALFVSGYLSYVKATDVAMACGGGGTFNCGTVQNSVYSEIGGIPIAWFGLGTNLIVLAIMLLEYRVPFFQEFGPTFLLGIEFFAFIYSVFLVYIQAAVLQAYCPWCLTHEALITGLFIASIFHWRRHMARLDA